MRRLPIFMIFLIFLVLGHCSRKEKRPVELTFNKLAEHLFLITGGGANVIASAGSDGLLLVDTKLPDFTEHIISKLGMNESIPRFIVLDTHYHPDHVIGNKSWHQRGALIIAHRNTRKRMETDQYSTFWDERIPRAEIDALPDFTFQKSITLHVNDDDIIVSHLMGHTDGDVIVYFQKANVIHIGDIVFNGIFPNSDIDDGGSIDLQILAVRHILTLIDDETTIIVGHGPPMMRTDLEDSLASLSDIRDQISRLIKRGYTLNQIIASHPTSEYEDDWEYGSLTRERYIELIYRQLLSAGK